jgi:tRNA pseudouridine65 synthase
MILEPLTILFQDDSLVAIAKPAGLLVHRTAIDAGETRFCVQLLRDQIGREVFPCHRLDKPTSGVLLFALNKDVLRSVNTAFAEGRVEKVYHAVVRGWIDRAGLLDYSLSPMNAEGKTEASTSAHPAITAYAPLERYELPEPVGRYASARFSLVELMPKTGRTHQLRRHMAHMRHPIIGDTCHGDGVQNRFFRQHLHCHRLMLSAISLCLDHPVSGDLLRIESAPEKSFLRVVQELETFRAAST